VPWLTRIDRGLSARRSPTLIITSRILSSTLRHRQMSLTAPRLAGVSWAM
jgi:hypothetical protein